MRQTHNPNEVLFHFLDPHVVRPMSHPHANPIIVVHDVQHESGHFVGGGELFADKAHDEVLPQLVGVAFVDAEVPHAAFFMLVDFPHRFDALHEKVDVGARCHLGRAFQVLIHAPELLGRFEGGHGPDRVLVPVLLLFVHIGDPSINSERVL